jgi:predicted alpha/beta hydrolase family esterase
MRDINDYSVLVLAGLNGAGEDHWMTYWERAFPAFRRVQQDDWEKPDYAAWGPRLSEAVTQAPRTVILLAHSLGTSLTMRWSFDQPALARKVAGAFLVAPTDRDSFDARPGGTPVRGFGGMILKRLPFPSAVVASRNDDRVAFDRARAFAAAWGSTFIDAGERGHIGSAAKLEYWPFGLLWFGQFVASLPRA